MCENSRMEKAIVTGAGGFIGSALARRLAGTGIETHAFVRPGSDTARLAGIAAIIHEVDMSDADSVRSEAASVAGASVFHLAASNIMSGMAASAQTLLATNVLGTDALIAGAIDAGAPAFVSTGSFLEYGPKGVPLAEDMRCDPPEIYSITKLAGTLLVEDAAAKGLNSVAFRLFTPYGPGIQKGRLIYEAIAKALRNEPLTLTRPSVTRDFIYVEDIVDALIEAAENAGHHAGQIYNLGSGQKTSLEELGQLVLSLTGSSSELAWGSAQSVAYDTDTWQADMAKTFGAFAWRPRTSLAEGIDRTIAWMKETLGL